jgi:hypothetical protein
MIYPQTLAPGASAGVTWIFADLPFENFKSA